MKKILYIWKDVYPWDVRVEKITNALMKDGNFVLLLARRGNEDRPDEIDGNFLIKRVGQKGRQKDSAPFFLSRNWKKWIKATVKEFKPDLIIVREMLIAEIAGKVAKKYSVPIIMDMAENYPACIKSWKKYNDSPIKRFAYHRLRMADFVEKRSVKYMNGIITVCYENSERVSKTYDFPIENTCVVHNTPLTVSNNEPREITKDKLTLFHHGFLTAEKSLAKFIEGFCDFAKHVENVTLIIAGDGDCLDDYRKIVEEKGCQRKVKFSGRYNYEELNDMISKVDIGVLPYQVNDFNNYTLHNKIFDYFDNGKPIITSMARPMLRVIEETKSGVSIDCEDAENITKWLEDNLLNFDWETAKTNSHIAAEKYSWETDTKTLLDFIEKFTEK
jgi:glycosyltransferase involved in cell wall biosynthesis